MGVNSDFEDGAFATPTLATITPRTKTCPWGPRNNKDAARMGHPRHLGSNAMGGLLFGDFGFKGLLTVGDEGLIAGGVQKRIAGGGDGAFGFGCLQAVVFGEQIEKQAVGAEEDVARQRLESLELLSVIGGHLRIFGIADQVIAGEDA